MYGFLDWRRGGNMVDITDLYFDFGPNLYADSAHGRPTPQSSWRLEASPYLQPASFFKVRELTFSYSLPAPVGHASAAVGCRVLVSQSTATTCGTSTTTTASTPRSRFTGTKQSVTRARSHRTRRAQLFLGLDLGL